MAKTAEQMTMERRAIKARRRANRRKDTQKKVFSLSEARAAKKRREAFLKRSKENGDRLLEIVNRRGVLRIDLFTEHGDRDMCDVIAAAKRSADRYIWEIVNSSWFQIARS